MSISSSGLIEGSFLESLDLTATDTFTDNNPPEAWLDQSPRGGTVTGHLDPADYSHFDSSCMMGSLSVDFNLDLEPVTFSVDVPDLYQGLSMFGDSLVLPFCSTEPSLKSFTGQFSECLETSLPSALDNSLYVFSQFKLKEACHYRMVLQ